MDRDTLWKWTIWAGGGIAALSYVYELAAAGHALERLPVLLGFFLICTIGMQLGAGAGTIAGALTGLCFTLWIDQPEVIGILSIAGMAVGFFGQAGKLVGALGFIAAYLGGSVVFAPIFLGRFGLELFLGVLGYLMLAERISDWAGERLLRTEYAVPGKKGEPVSAGKWSRPQVQSEAEGGTALEQWTAGYARKLLKLSASFQTVPVLAESFGQLSEVLEHAGSLAKTQLEEEKRYRSLERNEQETKRRVRRSFHIAEQTRVFRGRNYGVAFGTAKRVKNGELMSGDHFSCMDLKDGRIALGIFDGMGSGRRADRDSRCMIDTMEELLDAGFSLETSLRMLHAIMLNEKNDDTTLGVDFATLDLEEGVCRMVKAGAAASYVLHGSSVRTWACDSLPIGILSEVTPTGLSFPVSHGDILVMVSDGVTEAMDVTGREERFSGFLAGLDPELSPKEYAEELILLALADQEARDDMLVLVAYIL